MNNHLDIPELHQGAMRHAAITKETAMLSDISFKYIENNLKNAELVITSGFEIGCNYSIELSFENFSFTVSEGFVEDVEQMVINVNLLLEKGNLKQHIIDFQEHDTSDNISDAWFFNFNLCTNNIDF